ncbi:MAG: prolyl oligopeptidase family serine peptidase [Fuerstiella sp.]
MWSISWLLRLLLIVGLGISVPLAPHGSAAQTPRLYRHQVEAHWFAGNTRFWYRVSLPEGRSEFVLVDTTAGTRQPAFDHARMAELIEESSGIDVSADRLPVTSLEFSDNLQNLALTGPSGRWQVDLRSLKLLDSSHVAQRSRRQHLFLPPRRSVDRGGDVELRFRNDLDDEIELVWIDRSGQPVSYGKVTGRGRKTQHTFAGHVWLVKAADGRSLACFEADSGPNDILISDETLTQVETARPRSPERSQNKSRSADTRSPDGSLIATVRDHNLWLQPAAELPVTESDRKNSPAADSTDADSTDADSTDDDSIDDDAVADAGVADNRLPPAHRQLTSDATSESSFHKDVSRARLVEMQYQLKDLPPHVADVRWSPDGRYLLAFQTDRVPERRVYIVESAPADQLQPRLESYPYAKPGDPLPRPRPRLFSVADGREIRISDELFPNPFRLKFLRWSDDGQRFWLLYNERGHQTLRVLEVTADDGSVRTIVNETSETFIHYSADGKFVLEWLPNGELLWASERSGWNHLYRYRLADGRVLNPVTFGEWNVRRIEKIDRGAGVVWFYATGIAADQDPYHEHFCKVGLDGSGMVVLTEGDGTHEVTFSPDRTFFLDRCSRVDLPPVTELRRSDDGSLVTVLESADASEILAARGSLPRRFTAPGRDGRTKIWGIIHLPLNFDPEQSYPVVENIYAGPHDFHVPKAFRTAWRHQHQLADRGMIVVQIDGMGTAWRSKAFHDVCYQNLRDAGFPDRIAWMRAAAAEYPWMDLSRVGIYGGSAGGQNAMAALLWHGTFYRAAVADCGCHDNRMDKLWWNEQWMGWPVADQYVANSNSEHAYRLQGKLMLVVGELDRNVDPASTMQVVQQLIKADKNFEFVLVPGAGHGACERPWCARRRADFLAKHLKAR